MFDAKAYSAASATSPLAPHTIKRRDATDRDVQIEILYCGICHSDLHTVRNEWAAFMPTVYPVVPGHEIVGRVVEVGDGIARVYGLSKAMAGELLEFETSEGPVMGQSRRREPGGFEFDAPHALDRVHGQGGYDG